MKLDYISLSSRKTGLRGDDLTRQVVFINLVKKKKKTKTTTKKNLPNTRNLVR